MNHYFIDDIRYGFMPTKKEERLIDFFLQYEHTVIDENRIQKMVSEIHEKARQLNEEFPYSPKIVVMYNELLEQIYAYSKSNSGYICGTTFLKIKSYNLSE